MTQERTEGPTPNGGVYAIAYFKDKDGQPVAKEQAVAVEIVEFDKDDKAVWRTRGTMTPTS